MLSTQIKYPFKINVVGWWQDTKEKGIERSSKEWQKGETRLRKQVLTSVAALHPARMTAVLIRIQYILGCIFPFVITAGPVQEPPDRSPRRFYETKRKKLRVRPSQEETTKNPPEQQRDTHHTDRWTARHWGRVDRSLHRRAAAILKWTWARPSGWYRKSLFGDFTTMREVFEF